MMEQNDWNVLFNCDVPVSQHCSGIPAQWKWLGNESLDRDTAWLILHFGWLSKSFFRFWGVVKGKPYWIGGQAEVVIDSR